MLYVERSASPCVRCTLPRGVALRAHRVHPAYERAAGGLDTRFYTAPLTPVLYPCSTDSTSMAVCAHLSSVIMERRRLTFIISSQQRLVNLLAAHGFGWVYAPRMRLMGAMFRGSGVMWASQLRGSLRAIVSCVCRSLVCRVL